MQGFLTKEEAANVLGVSVRQINHYFNEGKLSRVYHSRRAWIPQAQVEALYTRAKRGPLLSQEAVEDLADRVERLENKVEVLTLGLGHGAKRPLRNETELLLVRQTMLHAMAKKEWSNKQLSQVADELKTIREEEVSILLKAVGPHAWAPLVDVSKRMLDFAEQHKDYPDRGYDILARRLRDARDRFYGLVYAASKVDGLVPSQEAEKALEMMVVPVNSIERHIAAYAAV